MKIFKLPDLGEGLQEAEIVQWHVKPGDTVRTDQPMVSVETAKAIVDIPADLILKFYQLSCEKRVLLFSSLFSAYFVLLQKFSLILKTANS